MLDAHSDIVAGFKDGACDADATAAELAVLIQAVADNLQAFPLVPSIKTALVARTGHPA